MSLTRSVNAENADEESENGCSRDDCSHHDLLLTDLRMLLTVCLAERSSWSGPDSRCFTLTFVYNVINSLARCRSLLSCSSDLE